MSNVFLNFQLLAAIVNVFFCFQSRILIKGRALTVLTFLFHSSNCIFALRDLSLSSSISCSLSTLLVRYWSTLFTWLKYIRVITFKHNTHHMVIPLDAHCGHFRGYKSWSLLIIRIIIIIITGIDICHVIYTS